MLKYSLVRVVVGSAVVKLETWKGEDEKGHWWAKQHLTLKVFLLPSVSSLIFAPVSLQKQTATSSKKINNVRIRFLPIVTPSQTSAGRRRRSSCSSRRWTTAAGRSSSADVLELPFLAEDSGCLAYEQSKKIEEYWWRKRVHSNFKIPLWSYLQNLNLAIFLIGVTKAHGTLTSANSIQGPVPSNFMDP